MKQTFTKQQIRLGEIAYARSGDKGSSANVGVIARTPQGFAVLRSYLSAARVEKFFKPLGVRKVIRYKLPNLGAAEFPIAWCAGRRGQPFIANRRAGQDFGPGHSRNETHANQKRFGPLQASARGEGGVSILRMKSCFEP